MRTERIIGKKLCLTLDWEGEHLRAIDIDWAEGKQESHGLSASAQDLKDALIRYENGENVRWPELPMDFDAAYPTAPSRKVTLHYLYNNFGFGQWTTYGGLARQCGSGHARSAGQAMHANHWPLVVPCHRVLGADGSLTGYSGADKLDIKRYLLTLEGIPFKG